MGLDAYPVPEAKEIYDLIIVKLAIKASMNNDRNYNGSKIVKFLIDKFRIVDLYR